MARPRKATDDQIFAATNRVMARRAPGDVTLTEIASEAGLTPGALVQRFGSKRGLMLALMERFASGSAELFGQLEAGSPSPLAALFGYADCLAAMGQSPAALAHHLAYLQLDLTDPDFHRFARIQAAGSRVEIERLAGAAIAAGELAWPGPVAELARLIETTVSGSLLTWAFYQDTDARTWMRGDLERLLRACAGLRRSPQRKSTRAGRSSAGSDGTR